MILFQFRWMYLIQGKLYLFHEQISSMPVSSTWKHMWISRFVSYRSLYAGHVLISSKCLGALRHLQCNTLIFRRKMRCRCRFLARTYKYIRCSTWEYVINSRAQFIHGTICATSTINYTQSGLSVCREWTRIVIATLQWHASCSPRNGDLMK